MPGSLPQGVIGRTLGSYQVVEQIGSGGMGVVFRAVHPLLGKKAAVKILLPEFTSDPAVVSRFFHEARASALIGHPGIVDVFDFGMADDGSAYLVMELLEGEGLGTRLRREHRLQPALAMAIIRQVTSAVGAAHDAGIIHRDLKPDNLYLVPDRDSPMGLRVKVLDFGVAKLARDLQGVTLHTTSGIALGTPYYMSPEQCCNAAGVDHRTDIYSLGCILFEILCGRTPFVQSSYAAMVAAHIHETPPLASSVTPGLPAGLDEVIRQTLAKNPEQRQISMAQLGQQLDAVASNAVPMAVHGPGTGPIQQPGTGPIRVVPGTGPIRLASPQPESVDRYSHEESRGRGGFWILLLGLFAAVIVAGAVAAPTLLELIRPERAPPPRRAAAESTSVSPSPLPLPAGEPASATVVEPGTAPATTPASNVVALEVRSTPAGAEVYRAVDGVRLGVTPLTLEVSATKGEMVLVVKKSGYESETVHLPADRPGTAEVKLDKAATPKKKIDKDRPKRDGKKGVDDDGALDPFENPRKKR